jgi:hypothetical protein
MPQSPLRPYHRPFLLSGVLFAMLIFGPPTMATEKSQGPAHTAALDKELEQLLSLLPGRYRGKLDGEEGDDGRHIYHTIEVIEMPAHGEKTLIHVLSLEGFDDPQPFQQKFYAFDLRPERSRNRMESIVLMRAPRWQPGQALDDQRLLRFPPECRISWRREGSTFVARVRQGSCAYESAAMGGTIVPDMTYVVSEESFAIRDILYRPDGSLAVPSQGGDFIVAPRACSDLGC